MREKEFIVSLRDGSSCIVEFSEKTNFIDETNDFIIFKNGFIRRDEIISVIHLNEKKENNFIDDLGNVGIYGNLTKQTGKIIDDAFNGLSKTLDRKLDIDGSGIIISSDDQAIKITNENVSLFEFKEDGTLIIKAPKINFS